MKKQKTMNLNDHLFYALERLNRDGMTTEEIEKEVSRAGMVTKIGDTLIKGAELQLKAEIAKQEYQIDIALLPSSTFNRLLDK